MAYDLLITNGTIIDGSGGAGFKGNIGVKDGVIAAVGEASGPARRTIDAKDLVVTPGFVDMHTHYDAQLVWDPTASPSCFQGVTSVLLGNCSFSIAPVRPEDRDFLIDFFAKVEGVPASMVRAGPPWTWETFPQYMSAIDKPLGVNAMAMVGHSALRYYFLGQEEASKRASTPAELEAMKQALREAVQAGAFGFTTDFYYEESHTGEPIPSRLATEEELFDLGGVLGDLQTGIIEILPESFMVGPVDKDRQMLTRLSLHSRRPVLWNQFAHTWGAPDEWKEIIKYHAEAARQGAQVYALNQCVRFDIRVELKERRLRPDTPSWRELLSAPFSERPGIAADPAFRERLRQDLVTPGTRSPHVSQMQILCFRVIKSPQYQEYLDRNMEELSKTLGKHPADIILEVAEADNYETELEYRGMFGALEEATAAIIKDPYTIVGESDAGAHCNILTVAGYATHLLGYWVRERGLIPIEDGVRRLTSMPAGIVGLKDRGLLKEGMAADINVFDPATVGPGEKQILHDFPGGEQRMVQFATGVKSTVVNGQVVVTDGELEGPLPGRLLRSGG